MMRRTYKGPRVPRTFRRRQRLAAGGVGFFADSPVAGTNLFINTRDRSSSAGCKTLIQYRANTSRDAGFA